RDFIDFVGVGDDYADGGNASDLLLMGRGKDVAEGGKGDDLLDGGREADKLFGGKGNDVLYGGRGKDILSGNADADVFVFDEHSGKDKITDFNLALDSLVFIQSAENEDFTDLNPDDFTFTDTAGGLLITYEGGQVRLVGLTTADAASINYGNGAALAAGVEELFGFFE
ncbi:MAG: calcium-binding protein, partial [Pseudomonadota bacterium]